MPFPRTLWRAADPPLSVRRRLPVLFCAVGLALGVGCGERPRTERPPAPAERPREAVPEVTPEPVPQAAPFESAAVVRFTLFPIRGARSLRGLRASVGDSGFSIILKLNRIDEDHARAGDTLIVPEPLVPLFELSPLPDSLDAAANLPKLLVVSQRVQAFGAYGRGTLIRWGPVSTGRSAYPTLPGLYHTNWKSKERRSTYNEDWLMPWYWNIESRLGISIHQYDLPGHPASHACVRLAEDDARWLYDWAEGWEVSRNGRTVVREGTPVFVLGEYAAEGRPPWKRLSDEPRAADVSAEEIESALAPLLDGLAASGAGSP